METTLLVLVLERGSAITHDLSRACRSHAVEILGPVQDLAGARAAMDDILVDVLVIETIDVSMQLVREATVAFPGVSVLAAATESAPPDAAAAAIGAGATGCLESWRGRRGVAADLRRAAAGELIVPTSQLSALVALIGQRPAPAPGPSQVGPLTRRELEVLGLLAQGLTTTEVAAALSISVLTVQSHVKSVLAKLDVHSKVEAIRHAWRSGALQMPVGA